jgi:hypothetical protein
VWSCAEPPDQPTDSAAAIRAAPAAMKGHYSDAEIAELTPMAG